MQHNAAGLAGFACVLMLVGCTEDPAPSAHPSPSQSSSLATESDREAMPGERAPAPLRSDWEELGPQGFLELRLGMSRAAALETGRITIGKTIGQCTGFYLAMYGDGSGLGAHGYFTRGRGLSLIHGQDEMHTPNGIRLGSPTAALEDSYAHLVGSDSFMTAMASDGSQYVFISENHSIAYFGLSLLGNPCLTSFLRDRPSAS